MENHFYQKIFCLDRVFILALTYTYMPTSLLPEILLENGLLKNVVD